MYQHPPKLGCKHPMDMSDYTTNWNPVHKLSVWDGRGTCETFSKAYYQEVDDVVKLKIHMKTVAESDLPSNLTQWEAFASVDEDCDETFEGEITTTKSRGRHKIVTIPNKQSLGPAGPAQLHP